MISVLEKSWYSLKQIEQYLLIQYELGNLWGPTINKTGDVSIDSTDFILFL